MSPYRDKHLRVTFRGESFEYFPGQVTPALSREIRKATGKGPVDLWNSWMTDVGWEPDVVASLIWAARLQTARRLKEPSMERTLQEVEDGITYDELLGEGMELTFIGWDDVPDESLENLVQATVDGESKEVNEALVEGGVDPEV